MICPKCGNFCKERERFCFSCGASLSPPQPQQTGWQPVPQLQDTQPQDTCPPVVFPQQPEGTSPVRGMYWFRFLICFQLFVSAACNVLYGVECLTGGHYQEAKELVYWVIPELRNLDRIYGVVLLVLGVYAIFTRMRLAGYRKNGPKLYLVYLGVQIAASLLYSLALEDIVASATNYYASANDFSGYLFSLIVNIVLLVASSVYFKKRKHLFVN